MDEPELCPDMPADLDAGRRGYVAGFLLDDADRVVLIRKRTPAWQVGLLNGVGGKVEPGESPGEAMRREFGEETGLDLAGWDHFASLTFAAGIVWFFRLRCTSAVLDRARTTTDEQVVVMPISAAMGPSSGTIGNVRWLLPLAAYTDAAYAPVVARELG